MMDGAHAFFLREVGDPGFVPDFDHPPQTNNNGPARKTPPAFDFDAEAITAAQLQKLTFPPLVFLAHPVLVEGVTLFAGREKIGKSWLMLDAAVSIARGHSMADQWATSPRDVLFLALEDGRRRLNSRIRKVFGNDEPWPDNLTMLCKFPLLGMGLEEAIEKWAHNTSNPGVVIIDTLQLIRPPRKDQRYADDTADMKALKQLAERLGISIVLVHHLRKAAAETDPFDAVSGSTGLAAGADATVILKRHESLQGFELYTRGRDVVEQEFAMEFDKERCRWTVLDEPPHSAFQSNEGKQVLDALSKLGEAGPTEIAAEIGIDEETAKKRLQRMVKRGEIERKGRGRYTHPVPSVPLSLSEGER